MRLLPDEQVREAAQTLKECGLTIIECELLIARQRARIEQLEEAVELLLAERGESVGRMAEA